MPSGFESLRDLVEGKICFAILRNKRLGLIGIKLGSLPQWNKNGEKVYTSLVQILDNHVIDYIPPEIVVTKGEKNRIGSRDGFYGMQLVGALSTDPRMVDKQLKEKENKISLVISPVCP